MSKNPETDNSDHIIKLNRDRLKHDLNIHYIRIFTAGRVIPYATSDLRCFFSNPVRGTITFVTGGTLEPRFHTYSTDRIEIERDMRETPSSIRQINNFLKRDKS